MLENGFRIETAFGEDCSFALSKTNQNSAAFLDELCCPVSNVAESLNDDALSLESCLESEASHFLFIIDGFTQCEENSAARCFSSSAHTALSDRLSCNAAQRVDRARCEHRIGVDYPRHLARSGSVVRGRNVEARADVVLCEQL